jgi:hypothetical protein
VCEYNSRTHGFARGVSWLWLLLVWVYPGRADDGPFLAVVPSAMEEPGNLEISTKSVTAKPGGGNRFLGVATEFEYSVNAWWTSELTIGGQTMHTEGPRFTGYEWENRFRLLRDAHWINPVLDLELESIPGTDDGLLDEVVGHDGSKQTVEPGNNGHYEFEPELILDSHYQGWTIAERLTAEKNIRQGPFAFGYAAGISRSLAVGSKSDRCNFCASNLQLGMEAEGGLGTFDDFGLRNTSQYIAAVVAWTLANDVTFSVSPGFGITKASVPLLLRFSVSYEVDGFGHKVRNLFHNPLSMKSSLPTGATASVAEPITP